MPHVVHVDYPEAAGMAVDALQAGQLIVLPTDTVYGVGALLDAAAIDRIFAAKQRPPDRAVPVLLSDRDAVTQVIREFPGAAQRLAQVFWPGPLTLILPKRDDLPPNLSSMPTVGVRVPAHAAARSVIRAAGGVMAVTSANRSDQTPACTVQAAIAYLSDAVAVYLDGGPCPGGVPSTVVAFDGDRPRVLREGPITAASLHRVLDRV